MAIPYAYVVGRFIELIGDRTTDVDRFPDSVGVDGYVQFTPAPATVNENDPDLVLAIPRPIRVYTNADGSIVDANGQVGVWLVADIQYTVSFSFLSLTFPITPTAEYTIDNPYNLVAQAPLIPSPTIKFVVNEQVYTDTIAASSDAVAAAAAAGASASSASSSAAASAAATVTTGVVTGDSLILTRTNGTTVTAGNVRGPKGDSGDVTPASAGSWTGNKPNLFTGPSTLRITLTGNVIWSWASLPSTTIAFTVTLVLVQDATGGRTVTWPNQVKWPYGIKPTLSTAPGAVDVIHLFWDGTECCGFVAGQALA